MPFDFHAYKRAVLDHPDRPWHVAVGTDTVTGWTDRDRKHMLHRSPDGPVYLAGPRNRTPDVQAKGLLAVLAWEEAVGFSCLDLDLEDLL
jgi:hypothetical protein